MPKSEETFSLRTKDYAEAVRLVRIAAVDVDRKFEAHRRKLSAQSHPPLKELPENQIKELGKIYYAHLLREDEDPRDEGFFEPDEPLPTTSFFWRIPATVHVTVRIPEDVLLTKQRLPIMLAVTLVMLAVPKGGCHHEQKAAARCLVALAFHSGSVCYFQRLPRAQSDFPDAHSRNDRADDEKIGPAAPSHFVDATHSTLARASGPHD